MKITVTPEEGFDGFGVAAVPPGQRDVRCECALFGLQTGLLQGPFDLCGEGGDRLLWRNARPQSATVPSFELSDAAQPELERRRAEAIEAGCYVVRHGPFDFSDEAQGQMKLFVANPAQSGAVVHRIDQEITNILRRADRQEKPVHKAEIGVDREPCTGIRQSQLLVNNCSASSPCPVSLETPSTIHDIQVYREHGPLARP